MNKAKVSIIIPIFNAEKYLDKCIQSVINQTYSNLEILLVNDGSTDSSLNICKSYTDNDARVVLINKANGGVASARNSGLDKATGDFVGFVDSDDFIDSRMYEELILAMLNNDADIVECGYYKIDTQNRVLERCTLENSITEGNYQCSREYLSNTNSRNFNWNKLYKKFIFDDLRYPDLSYSEDYTINVKAFYKCNKKVTIHGCYYSYLINDESVCSKPFSETKLDAIKAGKEMFKFHEERFSDLCPLIAVYIISHIMLLYRNLNQLNHLNKKNKRYTNKKYYKIMISEYKRYYPLIKDDAYKMKRYKKKYVALWLFSKEPKIYSLFEKVMKKFKRSS